MPYADPLEAKRRRLARHAADPERYKGAAAHWYAADAEPVPYPGQMGWQDRAACVGMDPELFFERHVGQQVKQACVSCPVPAECLGMALAFPRIHLLGFWAGATHQERIKLRAARSRAARDTAMTQP